MNLRDSVDIKDDLKIETIKYGQMGQYKDSIYEYKIISKLNNKLIERYCTTKLRPCKNNKQNGCFTGSCGFPFGLESYYKFVHIDTIISENGKEVLESIYLYTVCEPYCD